ncbi:MAG: hypothetical protein H6Q48_2569 [Deltaproteobacteria bacterium]|nr:hypothetical protein [Deltaproteobacteria bacterium]
MPRSTGVLLSQDLIALPNEKLEGKSKFQRKGSQL